MDRMKQVTKVRFLGDALKLNGMTMFWEAATMA
jgi:hypothetical protein